MLHIGTTEITLTKRTGIFHCPSCRQARPFQHQGVRRFLTLYWVPVIPLEETSQHIRCRVCRTQFTPAVLAQKAAKAISRTLDSRKSNRGVIAAALRLILVDGRTTVDEIAEAQRLIKDRTGIQASKDDILAQRGWLVGPKSHTAAQWLASANLGDAAADRAVRDVFWVASVQGDLRPHQLEELAEIPDVLGIKPSRFRRVISQAVSA